MIDSTILGEITNQFEGQQVNYFLCCQNHIFVLIGSSTLGNDVFPLKMIYIQCFEIELLIKNDICQR